MVMLFLYWLLVIYHTTKSHILLPANSRCHTLRNVSYVLVTWAEQPRVLKV